MLVATRNRVELVRSRRRLCGVGDTPVEGPISFNGGRERRFLIEKVLGGTESGCVLSAVQQ